MTFLIAFLLSILSFTDTPVSTEQYCNARFDFCVEYPADVFTEKISPTNADGVLLRTDDQDISLAIFGEYNIFSNSLEEQHRMMLDALSKTDGPIKDHLTVFTEDGFVSTIQFADHTVELRSQKRDLYFVNAIIRVKDDTDLADMPIRIKLDLDA